MLRHYQKLYDLLSSAERRKFFYLVVLIGFMALVDVLSVFSILPFLAVMAKPELVDTNATLAGVRTMLGLSTPREMFLVIGGAVFSLLILAFILKAGTLFAIARYAHMRNHYISDRLLRSYLSNPYIWFLGQNSVNLGRALLYEVDRVIGEAMLPAMRIFAHAASLLCIVLMLVAVNPAIALSVAASMTLTYMAIYLVVRRALFRIGERRSRLNAERYKIAQEAISGVKELKLYGLEDTYLRLYRKPSFSLARVASAGQIIGEMPRYFLEMVTFGSLIGIVLFLLWDETRDLTDIIPIVGLFSVAGLRMFPAFQQIYHAMIQMRMVTPILDSVHAEITATQSRVKTFGRDSTLVLPFHQELRFDEVRFRYAGARTVALDGLSMTVPANTTIGIVGGSGAGKTTCIDILLGLLQPDAGRITVDGTTLDAQTLQAWQNNIGYVPQSIFLIDDSVAANIAFGTPPEARDHQAVERAARLAELHEFVTGQLPEGYDTMVGERGVRLSGGQRQRIGIARALYHDPDVLIFDEATSALDNLTEKAVIDAVHRLGGQKTVIMIAHRLSTVRSCDIIFMMEAGRVIAQGSYDELLEHNAAFRRMAGVDT